MRISRCVIVLAAILPVLMGCASTPKHQVRLKTTATPSGKPALSYKVVSTNPILDESSLRYQEATKWVKTALSSKGMYESPNPDKADIVVELDYGLKGPLPRDAQGVSTFIHSTGPILHPGILRNPITGMPVIYPEERVYHYTETVYVKYITLSSRENREAVEGVPPKKLWSVEVSTVDESNDLRKYLPILAAVGMDYIGQNTGGERTVKIDGRDEAVVFVKKGL